MTLKEVILDDRVLLVSVHVDFGEENEWALWVDDEKTRINGQWHMVSESLDKDCEYLELQLYEREMLWLDDAETLEEDDEAALQGAIEDAEAYAKIENYGWKPVGEPFRIDVTH